MKKFACAALSTALLASMLAACGSSASQILLAVVPQPGTA